MKKYFQQLSDFMRQWEPVKIMKKYFQQNLWICSIKKFICIVPFGFGTGEGSFFLNSSCLGGTGFSTCAGFFQNFNKF
jgi:hypothetical protein